MFNRTDTPRLLTRRHSYILLLLLLFQTPPVYPERLPLKSYTSADGLGSSFIDFLMRDSRGFMWFCTRDGLSRFDGAQFVTYRIDDRNAPPGIETMAETRDGWYWISTTGGLFRFKSDEVSRPGEARGNQLLKAEFIGKSRGIVFEDQSGTLWLAAGYLYRIVKKDDKFTLVQEKLNLPVAKEPAVYRLSESKDGSLWLDTTAGVVRRLPDGRKIYYHDESNIIASFRAIISDDSTDHIWVLHDLELFVMKPDSIETLTNAGPLTTHQFAPTSVMPASTETEVHLPEKAGEILKIGAGEFLTKYSGHRLFQTKDGNVWLTTNKELIQFDGQRFHRFTTVQGLPEGMSQMAEDSAGNLWVGGQTNLARLDRKGLITYGSTDGLHSPSITAINESVDGTLYFADVDFFVNSLNGKRFTTVHPAIAPSSRVLWTSRYAFLDADRKWWILTNEKLYRFDQLNSPKPLSIFTNLDGLKTDSMFQIFQQRNGQIWLSVQSRVTDESGLATFDPQKNTFHRLTQADGFPPNKSVSSFAEESNGTLWFGFYEGGLVRYANNHFKVFGDAEGIPSGVLTDLLLDHLGRLWITSSSDGARRVDNPREESPVFTKVTTADGLSSDNVRTIAEDRNGNIYLGTVRGIDRISESNNLVRHYSVADGLAGDFVVDSHCDRNGNMWFATTNGISRLTPVADEHNETPQVWLGALRIAGVPQPLPELGASEVGPLELEHTQNNLQLEFFGMEFHPGTALRYQYRLEGADTSWSSPTEQRTITFANLRPGSYRFVVRAVNPDGVANGKPALVSFRILQPFWFRWWFVALSLCLLGGLAFAVARQRRGQRLERERSQLELRRVQEDRLRDLEQVRRRIAADLHDDIGSNLTRISLISEVAQRKIDGAAPAVRDQLTNIGRLSRELVDSMSEIVWAINPNKDHFSDLSQRMRHFASDVLSAKQINFQFKSMEVDHDIKVGANLRREFFLVFKEAINNVARHSKSTDVSIELRASDSHLALDLSDNGSGFDIDSKAIGHGLVSMRQRVNALGGTFDLESTHSVGTNLRCSIPLTENPPG